MRRLEVDVQKQLKTFSMNMAFSMNQGCLGILGSSGCGKSMTLKAIAGITTPDVGRIATEQTVFYDSQKHINLTPQKRKVGYLFQNYALFPNMTVEENIAAGIQGKRAQKKEMAKFYIRQFHLEGLEQSYPGKLSGGQQQRTALARILASKPDILLLDEPFSAMDSYLKEELQMELKEQIEAFEGCIILVSHDRDEIYRLCSHTMILDKGKNLVCKETKELFRNPEKKLAARLTGCKNISPAVMVGDHQVYAKDWEAILTVAGNIPKNLAYIGIRAHDFVPASPEDETAVNQIWIEPGEEVLSPFERTLIFYNREQPGKGMWMKQDRNCRQIPETVQVRPEHILLLEE